MQFEPTRLPEVILIKPRIWGDARGFFFESWQQQTFSAGGINAQFVQENHSHSARHVIRGLHFQIQRAQGKLIRVVRGEIFDVAVDLRRSSPRFGQWVGMRLSDANHQMLWVPPGFAHGYLTLSDEADVIYKCTELYAPEYERAIRWNDSQLAVHWPLPPGVEPTLSGKDAAAPQLAHAQTYP